MSDTASKSKEREFQEADHVGVLIEEERDSTSHAFEREKGRGKERSLNSSYRVVS